MPDVPAIETQRLRLRGFRTGDLEHVLAMRAEPGVFTHLHGRPLNREECWLRILRTAGHWTLRGYGYWAIESSSGEFLGEIGFGDFCRDITPSIEGTPEMGWALKTAAQGRGLAREAADAALHWSTANLPTAEILALVPPANIASMKLAVSLGFHEIRRCTYAGTENAIMQRAQTA